MLRTPVGTAAVVFWHFENAAARKKLVDGKILPIACGYY
jgi:hypothetical protein